VIQRHAEHIETSGRFRKEAHHVTECFNEEKATNFSLNSCYWERAVGCGVGLSTTVSAISSPQRADVSSSRPTPRKSTYMQNECSNRRKFWGKIIVMMTCNEIHHKK
jgi:hypothetical protein